MFSCSSKPAGIVNRSSEIYDKNNKSVKEKYAKLKEKKAAAETKTEKKPQEIESIKTEERKNPSQPISGGSSVLESQNEQIEVVAGDTLYGLSHKHQTTKEEIIKLNNLAHPYVIKVGTKITIRKTAAKVLTAQQIEVGAGDSLLKISKDYQVTLRDLIRQNGLTPPYNLKAGQKLIIPAPNYHDVKIGETLYAISRLYNMKVDELIRMNDLKEPYAVRVGEKIRITNLNDGVIIDKTTNKTAADKAATAPASQAPKKTEAAEVRTEKKPEPSQTIADKNNHFAWPINGSIISKFGPKSGGLYNDGINIKATAGAPVKAAEDGIVAYVGNELKGYGNLVIVKHAGGWITAYAHLSDTAVRRSQKVSLGDKIGAIGATGNVKSPQLYFGLRKGRDAVNPENYLKK